MFRWIVGSSLKGRFIVMLVAGALLAIGVLQMRNSPVEVFPEFAPPRVEVQTPSLGLSAEEVEGLVTVPLEQAFTGVAGLDTVRSKSVAQLSSIELIFKQGTDELTDRQLVQERLAQVQNNLPTWAAPPFIRPPLSATARTMQVGMSSKTVSLVDMSTTAYWTVRNRLLRIPGVANVAIWGERIDLQEVQADPARMAAAGVSLDQVMQTTADAVEAGLLQYSDGGRIGTGGFVETPNQRLSLENNVPVVTARDLERVPVKGKEAQRLHLSDVATVQRGEPALAGDAVVNNGPGLLLVVEKFPWGNALDVTSGVEQALDELRPGLSGIDFDTQIFRPATFIDSAIDNLTWSLLIGALLMILMLGAFLYEWRTALISVVAIPLSLAGALLVLHQFGYTINTMILAGLVIALGDIVDDAIVDVENVIRRLRQRRAEGSPLSTARVILDASMEIRGAIIWATLIEIAAVAPVILLPGLSGSFFGPLAVSYALTIVASMAVALTVTPALSLILLRNAPLSRPESPLVRWLQPRYSRLLSRTIQRPRRALAGAGVLIVVSLVVAPFLGQSLFPEFKERSFLVHWISKPGTSLAEERRITTSVGEQMRAIPGVHSFGSHIGQALLAEEVAGVDFGENWVTIDPDVDYDETLTRIQAVVDSYPGLFRDVQTYLAERIDEVLTGSSEPITVRIFGDNLETLRAKADEVQGAIDGVEGAVDTKVELAEDEPQIQVQVDLAAAQRVGVKPGDVRREAGTLVAGEEVGDIFRGGKTYDVQVWSTPETRRDVTSIRNMVIDTPNAGKVRMSDVADIQVAPTPNNIKHENGSRRIDVTASVENRDLGSVAGDVEERLAGVGFPSGFHAELLGEYAERQSAQNQILLISIGSGIVIFVLLQVAFGAVRLAALAFVALPMALVGGVLAAFLGGGVLSLGSLVGLLTVFGIAARNGIMLISHFRHLEHQEGETFGVDLVVRGARERLRPILMTALATGLAVLPLVVAGDIPGHEIEHPMAVVILGGLVTSTLLNLFVVPTLYLRFGHARTSPARAGAEAT